MTKNNNDQEIADYNMLLADVIERIDDIDNRTVAVNGSQFEPVWWVRMMSLRATVQSELRGNFGSKLTG